ncbi:COG1565: Uncharacterized conserved protein [hydrothermal vent metagenome]|uniref:COG1565: Uncharacterized conserved protein n=1 Tax=hydrothermal vent metagenome TaxID=652676 RepID=A0A1W1ECL4_9ZZZZ
MLIYTLFAIFFIIILFIIYIEYKNEKNYKENREKRLKRRKEQSNTQAIKQKIKKQKTETQQNSKNIKKQAESTLPKCKYPPFNFERLIEMGLNKEEATEYIWELIPQIKTQIPLIEEAINKKDFYNAERLTHSIKGSSTTVGTGGISDLLVEFNTYLKTKTDEETIKEYFKYLKIYSHNLEKQFS